MAGNISGTGANGGSSKVRAEKAEAALGEKAEATAFKNILEIGNNARGNLSVDYHIANEAALASKQLSS